MKFIHLLIFNVFFAIAVLSIATEEKHKLKTLNLDINVDYNKAEQTLEQLKILQADYQGLNETKDYSQCLDFVVALQCQKMDVWQAAIKELEIENKNSQEVQIPYLENRKALKVAKLKELLEITNESDAEKEKISTELEGNRKKVQGAVDLLQELYSVAPKAEFVQKLSSIQNRLSLLEKRKQEEEKKEEEGKKEVEQQDELNQNVDEELNKAHQSYLEKDQQIQAQTTVNVIKSSEKKINEALNFLSQSHESKQKELKLEKSQLKEEIEKLRQQISEFEEKVKHNSEKIEELQGKVNACENKPQNKEHDCDPIKEKAKKEIIDVEMMLNRLNLIEEQINGLMEGKNQVSESSAQEESNRKQQLEQQIQGDEKVEEILKNKNLEPVNPQFDIKGSYRDVGAEAKGDISSQASNSDEQEKSETEEQASEVKDQADMQLQDRNKEYEYKKGTIEYDGHYLKDKKGYKQYD